MPFENVASIFLWVTLQYSKGYLPKPGFNYAAGRFALTTARFTPCRIVSCQSYLATDALPCLCFKVTGANCAFLILV